MSLFVYFEVEEIDPLNAFELVLYQHFIEEGFALLTNWVYILGNAQLVVLDHVDELGDRAGLEGTVTEQHFE